MMISLAVFVMALSVVAVEGSCPFGFIRNRDSCYWFSLSTASNFEASRLCHRFGSHLAIITSRHEDDFIRNFLQRYGKAFAYWVGASDLRIEGTWTWDETVPLQKVTYTNWSPGQPDNYKGREHCMELKRPYSEYLWNDANCNNHINYICETSARSCPFGFIRNRDSCYWFSPRTASYFEASRLCHHFRSHLAIITSRTEDNYIRNFLQRHGKALAYWVGASDLRIEGTWTWDETVPIRKVTYSNWAPGQPDNNQGAEHCLELRRPFGSYLWNDHRCEVHNNYICETSTR